VLDAFATTDARWFASWDGLHYTFSARGTSSPPTHWRWQWQGGVSHSNTNILLNMLCNSCAGPNATRVARQRRARALKPRSADVQPYRPLLPNVVKNRNRCRLRYQDGLKLKPLEAAAQERREKRLATSTAGSVRGAKNGLSAQLDAKFNALEDAVRKQDGKLGEIRTMLEQNHAMLVESRAMLMRLLRNSTAAR
jgi:hypothetical protein